MPDEVLSPARGRGTRDARRQRAVERARQAQEKHRKLQLKFQRLKDPNAPDPEQERVEPEQPPPSAQTEHETQEFEPVEQPMSRGESPPPPPSHAMEPGDGPPRSTLLGGNYPETQKRQHSYEGGEQEEEQEGEQEEEQTELHEASWPKVTSPSTNSFWPSTFQSPKHVTEEEDEASTEEEDGGEDEEEHDEAELMEEVRLQTTTLGAIINPHLFSWHDEYPVAGSYMSELLVQHRFLPRSADTGRSHQQMVLSPAGGRARLGFEGTGQMLVARFLLGLVMGYSRFSPKGATGVCLSPTANHAQISPTEGLSGELGDLLPEWPALVRLLAKADGVPSIEDINELMETVNPIYDSSEDALREALVDFSADLDGLLAMVQEAIFVKGGGGGGERGERGERGELCVPDAQQPTGIQCERGLWTGDGILGDHGQGLACYTRGVGGSGRGC
jgi:hypothetical protein